MGIVSPRSAYGAVRVWPVLVCLIFLVLLNPATGFAADDAGVVTETAGSVQVQRGRTTFDAAPGMQIQVNDKIVTGPSAHIIVTLTDESTLQLGESGSATINQHAGSSTKVGLLGGWLRSMVHHSPTGNVNFEVHTPNAVAAARGTSFDTKYVSDEKRPDFGDIHQFTDLTVKDGHVSFWNKGNPDGAIDVRGCSNSTVADGLDPTQPMPFPCDPAWTGDGDETKSDDDKKKMFIPNGNSGVGAYLGSGQSDSSKKGPASPSM